MIDELMQNDETHWTILKAICPICLKIRRLSIQSEKLTAHFDATLPRMDINLHSETATYRRLDKITSNKKQRNEKGYKENQNMDG